MIVFKKVRYKNLLSSGNTFTEYDLTAHHKSLIIGENGSGKSTVLDAITFALFGKPFRKINKGNLVNSINGKDCVTEVEFDIASKQYRVVRGIKPNIFEIWLDGKMVNQDAAMKDYQAYLEKFILKMNQKSFTQIVILGSASFTPFMQLSPADRRTVIEDLLDIQIFSVMAKLLKARFDENKTKIETNKIESIGKEEKRDLIERNLKGLKQNNDALIQDYLSRLATIDIEAKQIEKEIETAEKARDSLYEQTKDLKTLRAKHSKYIALYSQIQNNLSRYENEHKFYCDNDNCPTCQQVIDQSFKNNEQDRIKIKLDELREGITNIRKLIDDNNEKIAAMEAINVKASKINDDITAKKSRLNSLASNKLDTEKRLKVLEKTDTLTLQNETELNDVKKEIIRIETEKKALLEDKVLIETSLGIMKDGGVKTKIIKQYIPLINKYINKYLSQMGFLVQFFIDESFSETIKSRYRDEFSYENFSEGEKARIDLAILFTWRMIAKMRNSVHTNLLILDEVFDGSLDDTGTEDLLKILNAITTDTNVFVISHKQDQMLDKFDKIYSFEKKQNFSRMK